MINQEEGIKDTAEKRRVESNILIETLKYSDIIINDQNRVKESQLKILDSMGSMINERGPKKEDSLDLLPELNNIDAVPMIPKVNTIRPKLSPRRVEGKKCLII